MTGWTAGGGFEWLVAPNWSLKAEALYWSLGNLNVRTAQVGLTPSPGSFYGNAGWGGASLNYAGVAAKAGVNYHFNWGGATPVVLPPIDRMHVERFADLAVPLHELTGGNAFLIAETLSITSDRSALEKIDRMEEKVERIEADATRGEFGPDVAVAQQHAASLARAFATLGRAVLRRWRGDVVQWQNFSFPS